MNTQHLIHRLFEAQVRLQPDAIAVIEGENCLSYKQLNEKSNQLAYLLRTQGIQSGCIVALCMKRSIDLLVSYFAVLKAGAAFLSLDPTHPSERLQFILENSKVQILLLQETEDIKKFLPFYDSFFILEQEQFQLSTQSIDNLPDTCLSTDLAYIIYTSGSTGTSKGVLIEHKSVTEYCQWFADYSKCAPLQRIDFSSNYIFDMAITSSIIPPALGLTTVICEENIKKNITDYLHYLETNEINLIKITPTYFKLLLHEIKQTALQLTYLKLIILGGENLLTTDCQTWLEHYPDHQLFNEYGPTEATVAVSAYLVTSKNLSSLGASVPIGNLNHNTNCLLLNKNRQPIPAEEIGELYLRGPQLARAYLHRPELTEQQFINDGNYGRLYKTGDLCRLLTNGDLEYLGRIDDQVKIRGFRVEPNEIEKQITTHSDIRDVIVLVREDKLHEKRLIAYYVLNENASKFQLNQLRRELRNRLPDYMMPSAFIKVDDFPLTANGKLDKSKLPVPIYTSNQAFIPPTTRLEKHIASIWCEELEHQSIGLEDDFFELGGNSLTAILILSKLNKSLNKSLSVAEFYQSPTIQGLVTQLKQSRTSLKKEINNHLYHDNALLPLGDFQLLLWMSNTFEPKAMKLNVIARKRFQGQIDKMALQFAFSCLLEKHEVLFYKVLKFRPAQCLQKQLSFRLVEKNLNKLNHQQVENKLAESIEELTQFREWTTENPLLLARIFYLPAQEIELQLALPHIISDAVTPQILFMDLSRYYLLYFIQPHFKVEPDKKYRDYLAHEHDDATRYLERDLAFWENYLQETELISFPTDYVVKDMKANHYHYSSYFELSESDLQSFQQLCAQNKVSSTEGICAAFALILSRHTTRAETDQNMLITLVKSTRFHHDYDETAGCFLRIEPIKALVNHSSTWASVSKQVHQTIIETSPYQNCSVLIKIACNKTVNQARHTIKKYLVRLFTTVYSAFCPSFYLNSKLLKLCERLASLNRENRYPININISNDFFTRVKKEKSLFDLKEIEIVAEKRDLQTINDFLDFCFIRDETNKPYLVISANLQPVFRGIIAREFIAMMQDRSLAVQKKQQEFA